AIRRSADLPPCAAGNRRHRLPGGDGSSCPGRRSRRSRPAAPAGAPSSILPIPGPLPSGLLPGSLSLSVLTAAFVLTEKGRDIRGPFRCLADEPRALIYTCLLPCSS